MGILRRTFSIKSQGDKRRAQRHAEPDQHFAGRTAAGFGHCPLRGPQERVELRKEGAKIISAAGSGAKSAQKIKPGF
jgi:hypothetical protein